MSSLQARHQQLVTKWDAACDSKNIDVITNFFEINKHELVSSDSAWFLNKLFAKNDIESVKYILQHSDPTKYINSKPVPLWEACRCSSFEMIRLIVSNGVIFNGKRSHLLTSVLRNDKLIKDNDLYLCVEYLLNHFDFTLYCDNTIYSFSSEQKQWKFDRIKMCNLIKSKRPVFGERLLTFTMCLRYAVYTGNFEFAEYLMDNGQKLNPVLFARCSFIFPNEAAIKWLLKHNVDINGIISDCQNGYSQIGLTPLFQSCVDKKYDTVELLLKNGADINKKCNYKETTMSPLQFIKQEFAETSADYFCNFDVVNQGDSFCGFDLSKIPDTPCPQHLSFNDDVLLQQTNDKYSKKLKEILNLENDLNKKYKELRGIFMKETELIDKKENIKQWKTMKIVWDEFLCKWKEWNLECFVEYLKRMNFVDRTFYDYFESDKKCKENIEIYLKNNMEQFEEKKSAQIEDTVEFKGIYLMQFRESTIKDIGITSLNDIQNVHSSILRLVKAKNRETGKKQKKEDNLNEDDSEQTSIKVWLTETVKLPMYIDRFIENNITMEIVGYLTKEDLKNMDIVSVGHQIAILQHAKI